MTLLLDQPLPGLALDDELFLAVLGGAAGITLAPVVVVRVDAPWALTVRLADEGVRVQGRAYFRVAAAWSVAVHEVPGGLWRPCQTRDVSADGVLLDDATSAPVGARQLRIPGQADHRFRRKPITRSDGKPITFWPWAGIGDRHPGIGDRLVGIPLIKRLAS
jgi:hypothetical protein